MRNKEILENGEEELERGKILPSTGTLQQSGKRIFGGT